MHTIPHLVRMNNFPFEERVLAIDTSPLTGEKASRPGIGTMEELRDCGEQLLKADVVDRVVDLDFTPSYRDRVYSKHFGSPISPTHDCHGAAILGYIFTIEECKSEYVLHFNSDMLLHQQGDRNWIAEAIGLMQQHPKMMFSRPLCGPPTEDGTMHQRHSYEKDPDGFYKFKFFSSRAYLINCKRFEQLLPLPILWHSPEKLENWEIMVSKKLEQTDYFRGDLTNPKAWTLHPKDRSPEFIQALPSIIKRIESGDFPPETSRTLRFYF